MFKGSELIHSLSRGNIIDKKDKRTAYDQYASLIPYPTTIIGDCLFRLAALSSEFITTNRKKMIGSALTVMTPAGDNLMVYIALNEAQENDILVISSHGYKERAILGEIIASYAIQRGVKGIVLDGAVRDIEALEKLDIPIYYTSISPNGPYKNGPGEINTPLTIGGMLVSPGDIIIGDADGVVVVKPEEVEALMLALDKQEAYEESLMTQIKAGQYLSYDWAYEKLKQLNTFIINGDEEDE